MKAITVRNPYAWAIAVGWKPVENRTRVTSYRGDIAIHAGAAWFRGAENDPQIITTWRYWFGTPRVDATDLSGANAFRHILAVADLFDCHVPMLGCCASEWADPTAGAHLLLRNVRRLETPVPATGVLGIWNLPADVAAEVERQVTA